MQNPTPLFPGFHLPTLRRKPRSAQQIMTERLKQLKHKSLSQLGACLGKFIPEQLLQPSKSGINCRQRVFSKKNTFWAFFSQILDADGGCQEVVRRVQAIVATKGDTLPSSSTAAYCQARSRLDTDSLRSIFKHTAKQLNSMSGANSFHKRRVVVVDGTGLSMPDTEKNQQVWPQQSAQKPGCGFPQATVCACFCLHTGTMLSYEVGSRKNHELTLLRKQRNTFKEGDIFLGDKGFCSYYDLHGFKEKGIDSVITLARRHPVSPAGAIKSLGKDDLLIYWDKPVKSSYPHSNWNELPERFMLRQIKVTVDQPGFRVKSFYIVTTLLDEKRYPANDIADLYFRRWDVELCFRDIKTTMGMDILRCKTPEMIHKEILMNFIAYNCIRGLILETAKRHAVDARSISFKASLQAIRQWEPHVAQPNLSAAELTRLLCRLRESIAQNIVIQRPGRNEPRAVKRRPKPFQLMTKPRHEMREVPHRGKRNAKMA